MSLQTFILDSIMNEIISSEHQSNIVTQDEIEQAIILHPLFGAIVSEMESRSDLNKYLSNVKDAKQETKKYKKYVFTEDALIVLQNFYNFVNETFPTRKSLQKRFPYFEKYIAQLFLKPKQTSIKFYPVEIDVDLSKPLFHTTNAFEIFEMKDVGTPYGPAWFSIDKIFSPDQVQEFHPDRGGVRVIRYKWIPSSEFDFSTEYPFLDVQTKIKPKIMDARKIKMIPADPIEKYFEHNGMILGLPEPEMNENVLMTYGRTWRPFVVKYLESKGFDGVLTKQNEIVIFRPERWITFENIEQGDMLYSALIESLKLRNIFKIPEIAEKYQIDPQSLYILYKKNLENIPVNLSKQIKA